MLTFIQALRRATAYANAGADAVLIHSKRSDSKDIDYFMKNWTLKTPVVIVPTKYYSVPSEHFKKLNISTIIWANHNLRYGEFQINFVRRTSITSMQKVCQEIKHKEGLQTVEPQVATLKEVFRLQNVDELTAAEKKYLPRKSTFKHSHEQKKH
jgi:phosphoenolpyruvate phosphomutase